MLPLFGKLKMANFCEIDGTIDRWVNGKKESLILCRKHGHVPMSYFYFVYANGYVAREPVVTCLECFKVWAGKEIVPAVEIPSNVAKATKKCYVCEIEGGLVECDPCKRWVCERHSTGGECDECREFPAFGSM